MIHSVAHHVGHGPAAAHAATRRHARRSTRILRPGVDHSLIDRQNDARRLGRRRVRVRLVVAGLPNATVESVADPTVRNVDAEPLAVSVLRVLPAEGREDVSRIEAGIVAELPRHHLEGLGEGGDYELPLPLNGQGVLTQVARNLHLNGAAARDHGLGLERSLDDHESVVDAALGLGDELLAAASEHDGRGQLLRTVHKDVEPLVSNLPLLEAATRSQNPVVQTVGAGLDRPARRLGDSLQITVVDAARAEQAAVGEVLRGEVPDRELAEDDVGPALDAVVELVVDDLPLGIDDALVLRRVLNADLGILLLGLELKLDVQEEYLGIVELLGHLLEAGVRERLLEGDTPLDEKGLPGVPPGDALDGDEAV